MFDLNAWGSEEKPKEYTYTIEGVSDTALKVKRSDKASSQTFSKATFQDLLKKGRLTIVNNTTFKVEIDTEFDPNAQFKPVDLG